MEGLAPMAATQTVSQSGNNCNFPTIIKPQQGVLTLSGYGIRVQVERGHLVVEDGIGPDRRHARLPRVGHNLKRLVLIGSDGMVTLAALRWLADQNAAFVMLERDGAVLAVTGPVGPSDARLRRSQSLAHDSGKAIHISRELISQKLQGQEQTVRGTIGDASTANVIASARFLLSTAKVIQEVRQLESQAAQAYWSTWHRLPVNFPVSDLRRVPEHWRTFGTRKSPLTGSPRLAVNPANAMLNYMYALLESEARLAASAVGLDPGIGFLHVDTDARDSLACDLMEPIRPQIDAFLLDWIMKEPLKREWFFEQRDGSCRLMASFAERLSESAPALRHYVAPVTEWVSRVLWSTFKNHGRRTSPPTYLTQSSRREAKGKPHLRFVTPPRPPHLCRTCGKNVTPGYDCCATCKVAVCTKELIKAAHNGRLAAHTAQAEAKRGESRRRHAAGLEAWRSSDQPAWLTEETYVRKIQPRLSNATVPAIRAAIGVSKSYATDIRSGKRLPHPRHWQTLAHLVRLESESKNKIANPSD
jgi:CRISPR-associated endonuclease Cas1